MNDTETLTIQQLLVEHEHAIELLAAFEAQHEAILNQHSEIFRAKAAIDAEIRAIAAEGDQEEITNGRTTVRITRKAAPKSYDAEILLANLPALEKEQPELIKKRVDSKKAQALAKKGVIPEKVMAASMKLGSVPAPSVTIETAPAMQASRELPVAAP